MGVLKEQGGVQVGGEPRGERGRVYVRQIDSEALSVRTVAAIAVTDAAQQTYTLPSDAAGVAFQLLDGSECWYGDADLDPNTNRGHFLMPRQILRFVPARPGFTIKFKCATGGAATLSPLEYLAE